MKFFLESKILGITVLLSLFVGLHVFGKHVYNDQTCERFNIDNIELRTGLDIPRVSTMACSCKDNIKNSKFKIDTLKVNVSTYIARNNFKLENDLYVLENNNKNSAYKVILDKKAAELTVDLIYKKH